MRGSERLFRNEYEFHVFAMQRSGHHAICSWIGGHFKGKYLFINDISRLKDLKKQGTFYGFNNLEIKNEIAGRPVYKDALIINVEERSFSGNGRRWFQKTKYYPRGRSQFTFNIIVQRDILNHFASRIKFCERYKSQAKYWLKQESIDMWKYYAKEFLGETSHLRNPKIPINYVDWFLENQYRNKISNKLNLNPSQVYLNKVPRYGKGSSFDLLRMNDNAQNMKVLERWKEYENHKLIKYILKDKEAMRLNREIFKDKVEYNET